MGTSHPTTTSSRRPGQLLSDRDERDIDSLQEEERDEFGANEKTAQKRTELPGTHAQEDRLAKNKEHDQRSNRRNDRHKNAVDTVNQSACKRS